MENRAKTLVRTLARTLARSATGLLPRDAARRRILFICTHEVQVDYLAEIWDILKSDPRLDFDLLVLCPEHRPGEFDRIRSALPVRQVRGFWAYAGRWDVAVMAEHVFPDLPTDSRHKIVRISHGFPGKREGGTLYAFGPKAYSRDGRIRYARMFVPSRTVKEWAVNMDPAFENVVAVVGSPGDDKMLAEAGRREEFRSRLGFKPNEVVVFVTSTWGPNSLFHRMGDAILAKARELKGEYRFILSVHPIEYHPQPAGGRVWGEYLREQRQDGFLLREPWEDWVPCMVASDILLTDHTSLGVHGVLLGKPFVFTPVPDELVEAGTVIRQIRDISPILRPDASDLEQALRRARNDYPFDKLREIASQMNSCPNEAADRVREEMYAQLALPAWDAGEGREQAGPDEQKKICRTG